MIAGENWGGVLVFLYLFRSPTWSAGPAGELADYSQATDQVGEYY